MTPNALPNKHTPYPFTKVFAVESHRWDSVGKKKKRESKRELKTAPCLTGLLFWVIDGNKLKYNFSVSFWREIIFWILKFWQEATVKMACQSNDFLSSYSSVKGKILFLLIFNFYSVASEFLFLNIFFPFWLLFFYISPEVLTFFPGTKLRFFSCDRTVQLSVLATQPAFLFVCSSMSAGDGVSKSRASSPPSSFETVSAIKGRSRRVWANLARNVSLLIGYQSAPVPNLQVALGEKKW